MAGAFRLASAPVSDVPNAQGNAPAQAARCRRTGSAEASAIRA